MRLIFFYLVSATRLPGYIPRNIVALVLCLSLSLCCAVTRADGEGATDQRFVVDIELQTLDQFNLLLRRAEQLLLSGKVQQQGEAAVVFVLHGPVLRSLVRQNYAANRETVDMAARLSALEVIDVKACRTWMGGNGVNEADLQPFVESVSYGPGEVKRLVQQDNYLYF